MEQKELIKRILAYRGKHNLSQIEFAEKCNITQPTLCNVENGKQKPSKLTMQKILNVIGEE